MKKTQTNPLLSNVVFLLDSVQNILICHVGKNLYSFPTYQEYDFAVFPLLSPKQGNNGWKRFLGENWVRVQDTGNIYFLFPLSKTPEF